MDITATCQHCGQQVAFYSAAALRGFQAENARRADAGRDPFPIICGVCRGFEHAPQGEAVRLFEPAPTQMPGQLAL